MELTNSLSNTLNLLNLLNDDHNFHSICRVIFIIFDGFIWFFSRWTSLDFCFRSSLSISHIAFNDWVFVSYLPPNYLFCRNFLGRTAHETYILVVAKAVSFVHFFCVISFYCVLLCIFLCQDHIVPPVKSSEFGKQEKSRNDYFFLREITKYNRE